MKSSEVRLKPLLIRVRPFPEYDNKEWLEFVFVHEEQPMTYVISLRELGGIIRAIGVCEDKKYPNGYGRMMTLEFLKDCLEKKTSFEELARNFQIKRYGRGTNRYQLILGD